ncbi:MAG: N-acetylmuramic acid 6-phosphate etherase [Gemmatimonadales bacterium]|nr:N-acetylmuramic acid 6-phosphate etherase [Gemmatimonadales bacterium]
MRPRFADPRLTEQRNPASVALDTATPLELVHLLNREDRRVADAVAEAAEPIARTIARVEAAFRAGKRLLYVGAGTSGRLGVLDAAECPPTFDSPPEQVVGIIAGGAAALVRSVEGAEDDEAAGASAMDAHGVGAGDVVLGIAASGSTPYVHAALARARALGAATALLAMSDPPAAAAAAVDECIVVRTGPEVVTGSTRMKAGTATKLVLNAITTGAMVRVGKTWGNLMVDVQAWNAKLVDRGTRILMETCGLEREAAAALLARAGGRVKLAIVMQHRGTDADGARALLAEHGGRLRPVVGDPPGVTPTEPA